MSDAVIQSTTRLFVQSLWPSLRRTLRALFGIVALPLFLIGLLAILHVTAIQFGWQFDGVIGRLFDLYNSLMLWVAEQLANIGVAVPRWFIESTTVYLSLGNTIARSEKTELAAISMEREGRKQSRRDFITTGRLDHFFMSVPRWLRGFVMRGLWPLVSLYRWSTPYIVEGPGPSGDEISSSVPRDELQEFAKTIVESGGDWASQTVHDARQFIIWQFLIGAGGVWILSALSSTSFV